MNDTDAFLWDLLRNPEKAEQVRLDALAKYECKESLYGDGTWSGFLKRHSVTGDEVKKLRTFLCALRIESTLGATI